MKVVGYTRVSTPIQAKEGESLKTQSEQIKEFAEYKKLELVEIYQDAGITGSKLDKRPDFIKLMTDAKEKKFQAVIFTRFSRFARNARDILNVEYELKKHGVHLISIKENIDSSNSQNRLQMQLLAMVAEFEREVIREQMNENKLAKWRENRMFNGKPPFGYRWNSKSCKLETHPAEANIYKEIVSMYIDLGLSFKDISLTLKEKNVRCKKAFFSSAVLSYILKNPAYYGNYIVNKYKYDGSKRTKELKPATEHIKFKIPPLITKTKWDSLQKKIDFNKKKSKRSTISRDYWLRDLLVCSECGGAIKPHHGSKRKDGSFTRYYSCYWAYKTTKELELTGRKKCSLPLIKAESIEATIWGSLMQKLHLNKERFLAPLIEPAQYDKQIEALDTKTVNLKSELSRKQRAEKRAYDMLEDEDLDENKLKQKLMSIEDEIIGIQTRLLETENQRKEVKEAKDNDQLLQKFLTDKKDTLRKLSQELSNLPHHHKKILMENLVHEKIPVSWYTEKNGEKSWAPHLFQYNFNTLILQRFIEQYKIEELSLNGPHNIA